MKFSDLGPKAPMAGAPISIWQRGAPSAALAPWIECLWYAVTPNADPRYERMLPTGTVDLVFNLRAEALSYFGADGLHECCALAGAVVHGPQTGYYVRGPRSAGAAVGVQFRPGAAGALLSVAPSALTDRHLALRDLWGPAADALLAQLIDTALAPRSAAVANPAPRLFALIEAAFAARLRAFDRPLLIHPAVAGALRGIDGAPTLARVDELRCASGYGAKRFIELFRAAVGMPPKHYCRIRRFDAVLREIAAAGPAPARHGVDWARVAADSGFADQSHLNREFRAFAGITPAMYRPIAPDMPRHVAIDVRS